jgi:hypothetical protein
MKEMENPSTFYGASSPSLTPRTWHKAELDKNCLFSKAEKRGIKNWEREKGVGKKKNRMFDK